MNAVVDLENELKALKKRIKTKATQKKIGEDDADQLRYIQEELQGILTEGDA